MAFAAQANDGGPGSVKARRYGGDIFPCLPDDLSLCILARLPLVFRIRCSLVCHSWKDAMEPTRMASIRKNLKVSEEWPVLVSTVPMCSPVYSKDVPFTIFNPGPQHHRHKICLPVQFLHLVSPHLDFDFICMGAVGSEVLMAAIANPKRFLSFGDERQLELMQGVYSFDCLSMKWQDTLFASLPGAVIPCRFQRNGTAVDMNGGYLYVAGGFGRKVNSTRLQGVERLDVKTKKWEALPDPHVKRVLAVGVVMGGHFHMIGGDIRDGGDGRGRPKLQNSGEIICDSATGEWILVPQLWPRKVFRDRPEGRVVVLREKLYALRRLPLLRQRTSYVEELVFYECAEKRWMSLGYVPLEVCDGNLYGDEELYDNAHLLKIGDELWAGLSRPKMFVATKPTRSQPLSLLRPWSTFPPMFFTLEI